MTRLLERPRPSSARRRFAQMITGIGTSSLKGASSMMVSEMRSGRLTVLRSVGMRGAHRFALCKCDCGAEKEVRLSCIKQGTATSCGCITKERLTSHGLSKHPLYKIYKQMINRCTNPKNLNFPYYGGRGIKVCKEWLDPSCGLNAFISWADGVPLSDRGGKEIDRIDYDGDYSPANCRFANRITQNRNTRTNTRVLWDGKEMLFIECFELFGNHNIAYNAAWTRYSNGWPLKAAITKPYMRVHSP